ncbi:MAG TPA: D-glycerate dehydrogenase [Syntrophales bacterium]|nr:D-glycerate dehydrogenase [Syntrophales bacterium]HOL59470.1 D-glycerate dehydrogenase [Syntrophales bacterium]HPO34652.1 D-glycerate dehydrogenase [Syntrophales bacterium]
MGEISVEARILVSGKIPQEFVSRLEKWGPVFMNSEERPMTRKELLSAIGSVEGFLSMLTDSVDEELLEKAPRLKVISNLAVGYNNIDVAAATRRGIMVTNTPGVLTEATAELTFGLILAVARRICDLDRRNRDGEWRFWSPFLFLSREVSGKRLGIVGLGRIGKAVAKRAQAFNMTVLYHNRRRLPPEEEEKLGVSYRSLEGLLSESDFVSLHVPLTEETKGMIGERELRLMKKTAYLINTARGTVVDERALFRALKEGWIEGAGLDVYEHEPFMTPGLAELRNVVLTPHVGSATYETRWKMAQLAADNLVAGLSGSVPPFLVNPEVLVINKRGPA